MSNYTSPPYYVQRHRYLGETTFLVRRRKRSEPGPLDVVVRQFEQADDAHAYAISMNETQERIHAQEKGTHHVNI